MWIDRIQSRLGRRLRSRKTGAMIFAGLFAALIHPALYGEQYRSKLLLQPGQTLDETSALSIEQMEAQFQTLQDSYSRSSAGMQLAQHYVQQKQYDKAIQYYRQALAADGLSPLVNQRLQKELVSVYLTMKNGKDALNALNQWQPLDQTEDREVALMFAQASYLSGDYLQTARALDKTMDLAPTVALDFHGPVLALSFSIGDFTRAERLLRAFIELQPNEPRHWFQLTSVYLKQEKTSAALAVMTLANSKGIVFSEQNLLLYSSLLATENNPYKAATVLQKGLDSGRVSASGKQYRRLFEYWFQARETERALVAIALAAQATKDVELYLYQAQLLMQQERWQDMNQTVLEACETPLPPAQVGQANLLLGISELKMGKRKQAREAFINATLVGGVNEKAGEWLRYMDLEAGNRNSPGAASAKASGPCLARSQ